VFVIIRLSIVTHSHLLGGLQLHLTILSPLFKYLALFTFLRFFRHEMILRVMMRLRQWLLERFLNNYPLLALPVPIHRLLLCSAKGATAFLFLVY